MLTGNTINYVKFNLQQDNGDQKFLTTFIVNKAEREKERERERKERERERERERE